MKQRHIKIHVGTNHVLSNEINYHISSLKTAYLKKSFCFFKFYYECTNVGLES